jgi:hypothetical protein
MKALPHEGRISSHVLPDDSFNQFLVGTFTATYNYVQALWCKEYRE